MENTAHSTSTGSKKAIWAVVIAIVVVAAVLIIVLKPFQTTEEFNPSFVYFEDYASLYNGQIQEGGVVLNDTGYVSINLAEGEYALYYNLNECPNPSGNFDYTYPDANGNEVSYDPLKEKIITNAQGKLEKVALSETEKSQAILKEKVYVLETENTDPVHNTPISPDSVLNFKAGGLAKFSYNSKCDGSKISLSLYRMS